MSSRNKGSPINRFFDTNGECAGISVSEKMKLCFVISLQTQTIMPVSVDDLQRLMVVLADEEQLKVSSRNSTLGGVVAGVATTVGGLLIGPPGLLVGGALGGILAYWRARKFKSVSQVISGMNASQKQLLFDAMKDIIGNLNFVDHSALLAFLSSGPGLLIRQQLMDRMVSFVRDQMRFQMAN